MSCSALTWSLDALVLVALIVNLVCIVILRRKTRELDEMIEQFQTFIGDRVRPRS